jgi:hypothetical protein
MAASKEQGSKMMSHKDSTSRYPTMHIENSKFPLFCLLALVGIKFLFYLLLFFDIFLNQRHKSEQHQISAQTDERYDRYNFRSVWENWCWNFVARIMCLPDFFNFFENAKPSIAGESYVQLFECFPGKQFTSIGVPSEKLCPI